MDSLIETLKNEMQWYSGHNFNSLGYLLADDIERVYAVIVLDYPARKISPMIVVMARIVEETIVIEEDRTDKRLFQRLEAAGIPRDKIVLAYAGEALPESQPQT